VFGDKEKPLLPQAAKPYGPVDDEFGHLDGCSFVEVHHGRRLLGGNNRIA